MMCSRQMYRKLSVFSTILFGTFISAALAQNSTQNDTLAAPYSSIFDAEVYNDGTGQTPDKKLNNPTVVAVNVPEGDNRDDLFIHFSASADKFAWAGFGFGDGMKDSLMFLVYRSENDTNNITVSPRLGRGHSMPSFTPDVNFTMLDLSGVDKNNRFVLNMQCFNCRSWQGGKLTISDGSKTQPVFYAFGPETSLASDDQSALISQHSRYASPVNLYLIPGTPGVPIVDDDPSEPRFIPGRNGTNTVNDGSYQPTRWSLAVHAFFMCFAFSIVFPGGFLLLRLFERVWLHWIPQTLGVLCVIAGLGAGIRASIKYDKGFSHPHQIFGFILVFILLGTWTLGFVGHRIYKKTQTPSPLMKVHKIAGPLVIVLGVSNALIGFAWMGLTRTMVTYALFNLLVVLVIGGFLFWKKKRDMRKAAMNSHAASNFREGNEYGLGHGPAVYYGSQPPPVPSFAPHSGNGIQMQTFHPNK